MKRIKIIISTISLLMVISVGVSSVLAQDDYWEDLGDGDDSGAAPKCNCRYANSGKYGVKGPKSGSPQNCDVVDCWIDYPQ